MSNSTRCAACKSLRRRCSQDCALAPYFPANNPQRFACVHRQLPIHARAAAADSMTFEASSRIQDPIYGCTQTIFKLQHQIIQAQYEIAKVQAELANCNAQHQMQQLQQQNHNYQDQNQYHQAAFEQEEEFQFDRQRSC
ncbi:hypothetical protein RHGRI_017528 [Rhododendron griersonianum]|uniref:LOB domain-containing protein n=1 Tax=Rhododendron griersonianum TaxID=479676 RepID=A0AAV6JY40_9ERIC|nr:hypothetical protein RHGRI_017528 [Rhododendron griersonianum]